MTNWRVVYPVTVTPFVGVWIEICNIYPFRPSKVSLPSWECGLKLQRSSTKIVEITSLPSWECGMKSIDWEIVEGEVVTPFVGVWIEIRKHMSYSSKLLITPFVGVWIEITQSLADMSLNLVTPFVGVRI